MSKLYDYYHFIRVWQGPSLDLANQFANVQNLMMTAVFFHTMLPLSIPIGTVGLFLHYWSNKVLPHYPFLNLD